MALKRKEIAAKYWDVQCAVFNGCQRCSPACANCWAVRYAWRFIHNPNILLRKRFELLVNDYTDIHIQEPDKYIDWTGLTRVDFTPLEKLARVRKPQVVAFSWYGDWMFPTSIGYPSNLRTALLLMAKQHHVFLTLTKRPEKLAANINFALMCDEPMDVSNIWIGVSAWDQASYETACKYLAPLQSAGWHTWISLEPMLSPVIINRINFLPDWIVVGAETGRNARHIDKIHIENIIEQCERSIPVFVKQYSDIFGRYVRQYPPEIAAAKG